MDRFMISPNLVADPNYLTSGEETLRRDLVTTASLSTGTQTLRLSYFTARKTETTTQVRILSGSTAAGATPTLCRLGLYLIDAADGGSLVASTANDTTLFAGTGTPYVKSWSTPYAKRAGSVYALGVLVVSAAALPTLAGAGLTVSSEAALPPRLTSQITAQADLPGSFTAGQITASLSRFYGVVLP